MMLYQYGTDTIFEFMVYDEDTNRFIDANNIPYNNIQKTLGDYLYLLDESLVFEERCASVTYYDYDHWKENNENSHKAIVKIQEDVDIFGVDSERKIPTSLNDIPADVRKAYFELIQLEMGNQDKWQELNTWTNTHTKDNIMYLIDVKDVFIVKDENIEEYEYLVKSEFFDGDDISISFHVYSKEEKKFINAGDIEYSTVGSKYIYPSDQYRKHDRYNKLEKGHLISKYSYEDWLKNQEGTLKVIKNINEGIIDKQRDKLKSIPSDVRKAFFNFITSNEDYNSENNVGLELLGIDGRFNGFCSHLYLYDMSLNKTISEKFKYILISYVDYTNINESTQPTFYGYDTKYESFEDISNYSYLYDIQEELYSLFTNDEFDKYDQIILYTGNDWLKNKEDSVRAIKKINK